MPVKCGGLEEGGGGTEGSCGFIYLFFVEGRKEGRKAECFVFPLDDWSTHAPMNIMYGYDNLAMASLCC